MVRQHTTVRQQAGWPKQDQADVDTFDDDLFVDGDERRRQRVRAIGAVRPDPLDVQPDNARAAPAVKQPMSRHRKRSGAPAWIWALLGFFVGIGFWHAIGFWSFISEIVLPPSRVAQTQLSGEATAPAQNQTVPGYNLARPTKARP